MSSLTLPVSNTPAAKRGVAGFFVMHYGLFHLAYLGFLAGMTVAGVAAQERFQIRKDLLLANIFPVQAVHALAAAVGVPDPVRTERVKAFIVLSEGRAPSDELAKEIQDWVRTRLAAHEYPRDVEFVEAPPGVEVRAVVAADDDGALVELIASGLDPDVIYELWLSPPGGRWDDRVAAGTFRPDAEGDVDVRLHSALPAEDTGRVWATTSEGEVALDTE